MDNKTFKNIALGLGVVLLVVLVLGFVFGWFQRGKLKLVEGDGPVDRLPGGGIDESRYFNIAKGVKTSLEGINYQSTFFINSADQLLALNKNELRVVNNIYARDLKTKDYPSLRSIISGEFMGSTLGVPTPCTQAEMNVINSPCNKQKKVLEALNLINA